MQFWFIILFATFLIIFLSQNKRYSERSRLYSLLCFILIVMSSLRCGLGEDYLGYLEKISYCNDFSDISLINEPLFVLLAYIVNNTSLTPVFFFLMMSILALVGIFSYYIRRENGYMSVTILFFVLFPALFFNTFNIVRQFAAAGIFFYSIKYIERKDFVKYLVCIIIAALLHISSIILLPFYFILSKSLSKKSLLIIFIVGLISSLFLSSVFSFLDAANIYRVYLDTEVKMGSSTMIILYNILFLLCLFRKKYELNSYDTISTNLLLFLVIFSDLSYTNFYFYRISVFFLPVAAYMLPKVVGDLFGHVIANMSTIVISVVLFLVFFVPNQKNQLIVRDDLLPFSAFYSDTVYNSYIRY